MLVGEQPGDKEDRAGHPFVGPAGRLLDEALDAAGLDRQQVYVTNAVSTSMEGARQTPHPRQAERCETAACRPWLDGELDFVSPQVLVPLGATAAQALLGRSFG